MDFAVSNISYGLIIWQIVSLLMLGLWMYALVDVLKNSFERDDKIIWILVVLFAPVLGAILYLFIGKKRKLKQN